jgi:hypothetical protein
MNKKAFVGFGSAWTLAMHKYFSRLTHWVLAATNAATQTVFKGERRSTTQMALHEQQSKKCDIIEPVLVCFSLQNGARCRADASVDELGFASREFSGSPWLGHKYVASTGGEGSVCH